jgi:hypothetical protein
VIQAGASLSTTDLKRNGVEDPQALYDLIYSGKGRMPGYGEKCAPKVCSCSLLLVLASCAMMHPGMSSSSSCQFGCGTSFRAGWHKDGASVTCRANARLVSG